MNNKKAKIFLLVGLICFVLIAIGAIISIELAIYRDQQDLAEFGSVVIYVVICLLITPGLATMLSGIRSTYKLLKYKPQGKVKICYVISASVAFLALVSVGLCGLGLIIAYEIKIKLSNVFIPTMLFASMGPTFIISFVLGSIPIKRKKEDNV